LVLSRETFTKCCEESCAGLAFQMSSGFAFNG
jgi:hypothetical protein